MIRIPYIDMIRDREIERNRQRREKYTHVEYGGSKPVDDDKFKPVSAYEIRANDRGYVDVYDVETGEFIFSDDTSFAAKEYILRNQRVSA